MLTQLFRAIKRFLDKVLKCQLARYAMIGALNNVRGYLIYLLITWLWLDPKIAVSIMYPIGATLNYFGHASYSFSYTGSTSLGAARYFIAHLVGYASNIGILYLLCDKLGYPHQLAQLIAILAVSSILFLLFKHFVFRNNLLNSAGK